MSDAAVPNNVSCSSCVDRSLLLYEHSLGSYICTGCGCVLGEHIVSMESSSALDIEATANFIGTNAPEEAYLSRSARVSASSFRHRSATNKAARIGKWRRDISMYIARLDLSQRLVEPALQTLQRHFDTNKDIHVHMVMASLYSSKYPLCHSHVLMESFTKYARFCFATISAFRKTHTHHLRHHCVFVVCFSMST